MERYEIDILKNILEKTKEVETIRQQQKPQEFQYEEIDDDAFTDHMINLQKTQSYIESYIHHLENLPNVNSEINELQTLLQETMAKINQAADKEKSICHENESFNDKIKGKSRKLAKEELFPLYNKINILEYSLYERHLNKIDGDKIKETLSKFNIPFIYKEPYTITFYCNGNLQINKKIAEAVDNINIDLEFRFLIRKDNFDMEALEQLLPKLSN